MEIDEVLVFYSPARGRWILRPVSDIGVRFGDEETQDEPGDELLRRMYGDVKITRGYGVTSTALMERLGLSRFPRS